MQLGREPFQTELDDAVEKEIAAVVLKNEERKKRKGIDGGVSVHTASKKDIEDRLLMIEDSIEKWDEKMGIWGSMLSKLYQAKFRKDAAIVDDEDENQSPLSEKEQCGHSEDTEDSGGEKGSVQSSDDDESGDGRTSEEHVQNPPGKEAEVRQESGKLKRKEVEEAVGEADLASVAAGGGKQRSMAGPSERGGRSVSTAEKVTKVSSS